MVKSCINTQKNFFVTCPKNLEGLLEEELISLGVKGTKQTVAGVNFVGDMSLAYRVCLWSRLANRVLLPLAKFDVKSADELYKGVSKIRWLEHLDPKNSLLIDFTGTSYSIKNSHFGALKVKDAIVDQIRKSTGKRPSIDKENPDLRINAYLYKDVVTVSIDLSGDSLHRRGYRSVPGAAPVKENLAAAILYRSNWLDFAKQNKPLFDPMCGSGTILIEAVMMAQDYAPGLLRKSFGFSKWKKHNKDIWTKLLDEAKERRRQGEKNFTSFVVGEDCNSKAVAIAKSCIKEAGLEKNIKIEVNKLDFGTYVNDKQISGLVITNSPYGKRLEEENNLITLYKKLGDVLRKNFLGWSLAFFTGNPEVGKNLGIRPQKKYSINMLSSSGTPKVLIRGSAEALCCMIWLVTTTQAKLATTSIFLAVFFRMQYPLGVFRH